MPASSTTSDSFSDTFPDMSASVGLSDPTNAQHRRALLDLLNRLRNTGYGVQKDIDLPMIAVIGNQSAGKSSLIESISGLTLPRSTGTCTRCPTECRLTHTESDWTCVVKLHLTTDERGAPIKPRVLPFGEALTSKVEVEERIRRAQRAILNPRTDPETFLRGATVDENETSFSRNYVSLDISGRDLADLSFVDLPGLIASVGQSGRVHDIELVKNLVISYIERPSCLILLTVACETDFENQGAHHLAKQFDPDGKRTVGVLTKPDRIPAGEEESWIKLIRNDVEPLANNWFCVKQPSSTDIAQGITWAAARAAEDSFFAGIQPWCDLEEHLQSFLRTARLTERLSHILAELISKRLPEIQDELYKVLQHTEKDLKDLPPEPPADAVSEALRILSEFHRELSDRIEGTPEADGLLQKIRVHTTRFKREIRATAPSFIPWPRQEAHQHRLPPTSFLDNEEKPLPGSNNPPAIGAPPNSIYIEEVMERAEISRTRELPDHTPFVVQQNYIREYVQKWTTPSTILFDAVYDVLKKDLENTIDKHFKRIGRGGVHQSVLMIVQDHLDNVAARTRDKIEWLVKLENDPQTQNPDYYLHYRDKFAGYYRSCRHNDDLPSRLWGSSNPEVNRVLAGLAQLGISARADALPKLLPSDPMQTGLDIMASVRAYFQVSYKRFVDAVCMSIDHEAIRGVERGLDRVLWDGLEVTGPGAEERCAAMFQEPAATAGRRQELTRKIERLQMAKGELRQLTM
ncbi:P-loop containing nucleoside triphosphate hydrolase protein [Pisolithus thermaeus]|nr:P-loop containing nucleoside triphosphate hydrolase protein [Pisolithus thermaeus]